MISLAELDDDLITLEDEWFYEGSFEAKRLLLSQIKSTD